MKGYYRHVKSMDLVLEVIKIVYRDSKRMKVKANWWNLGWTGNPWLINKQRPVTVEIQLSGRKDWQPISKLERFEHETR